MKKAQIKKIKINHVIPKVDTFSCGFNFAKAQFQIFCVDLNSRTTVLGDFAWINFHESEVQ